MGLALGRGSKTATAFAAMALVGVALHSATAEAKDDEKGRPWARGTWGVSPNLGIGFSRDLIPLTLGVGGSYYVAHGLAFGLSVNDTILIYTSSFKSRFPDVQNQIPTNSVYVTPSVRYVFYRNHRFSPYVFAGLGPVFFNHGGGTRGYWAAGPGVLIGLGGPLYLNLGVAFSGIFPTDKCLESFEYVAPDGGSAVQFDLGCGFGWGPSIGISFAPRGRAKPSRRERRRQREAEQSDPFVEEPSRNPMGDTEPAEPPVAGAVEATPEVGPAVPAEQAPPGAEVPGPAAATDVPPPAGSPSAEEPIPTDAPPVDAPPTDAPPTDAPPTDAPPTDAPPTDAPPTDAPPTDAPPTDAPPTTDLSGGRA